jgi:hypothetical protein
MSPEQIKEESENFLTELGIGVNHSLPTVETVDEVTPRSATDVAKRICALSFMIRLYYGYPIDEARQQLQDLGLWEILGSTEVEILTTGAASEQEKINLGWQAECVQALAWGLQLCDLDHTSGCDADLAERMPFLEGVPEFIAGASLRSADEVQKQVDLIYRMHWYAVNCRLNGTESKLNESVIKERRRALDWMYGVAADWDEMPMDT